MDKRARFGLHWVWGCTAPKLVPNARLGDAPKGALGSLGGGVNYISHAAFGCQYAEESNAWIKEPVLGRIGGGGVPAPRWWC